MSSQTSTVRDGVVPSRRRGYDRVAAIMDAAALVFAGRGFDAATMTEIAAASGTAIGSLYRFFPTKALLADAVFARYADGLAGRVDALLPVAAVLSPDALAERLLLLNARSGPDREAALVLAETRDGGGAARARLRAAFRTGVAAVLAAAGVPVERAAAMAPAVVQAIKALPALLAEGLDEADTFAELRLMLGGYLAAARDGSAAAGAASSSALTRGATSPA